MLFATCHTAGTDGAQGAGSMTILNATDRTQDTWLDGYGNEPTRGLDLPAKHEMWSLLRDLAAREQVTTFLSSHEAQEI